MPALLLVRHGQASFGAADYDVLSETGHEQARAVAAHLTEAGVRVDRIVAGALRRQQETAAPIAEAFGLEVETDERWAEYSTDDVLGIHSDAVVREHAAEGAPKISSRDFQDILEVALRSWIDAGRASRCREPFPHFSSRIEAALHDAGSKLGPGETGVVVTSGGVIGVVACALLGVGFQTFVQFNRVTINAAITKVAVGRSGATLVSFNEHQHLGGRELLTYR